MTYQDTLTQQLAGSPAATAAYNALTQAGGQIYIVGGAVRDAVMGNTPKDIDLMVSGLDGNQIEEALAGKGKVNLTGKQFGVYRLRIGQDEVEIAMPRSEVSTGPRHTDFKIEANPLLPPGQDLERRDFTANAMAFNPDTQELLDPFNGQQDIVNGHLRMVNGNAFRDDPLRIVRALVAYARFGLEPDEKLLDSMKEYGNQIRHLPAERIQMELDKLLSGPNPSGAFAIAEETGIMDYLVPELSQAFGFDQMNPHHDLDVGSHTLMVLSAMTHLSNDPDLRLAALMHDVGKPDSFWHDESAPEGGGGHFYKKVLDDGTTLGEDHEEVGADLAHEFMTRLRYPNARIDRVTTLVRNHMFPYFTNARGARKFLNSVGGDVKMAMDLLTLREADASGKRDGAMNEYDTGALARSRQLLQEVIDNQNAFTTRDLDINGSDLLAKGMKPGPEIGATLERLLQAVIDDPSLNTREQLLSMV
jgi:tRNA nucleotidyltransferase (CCA-adding enzyme)